MGARTMRRWALLCVLLLACRGGFEDEILHTGVARIGGPGAEVLFAFKAGLHDHEQIWLWLEDGRLHHVETGTQGPRSNSGRWSTPGYRRIPAVSVGSSTATPLSNHVEQVLLPRGPSTRSVRRVLSYELATGRVAYLISRQLAGAIRGMAGAGHALHDAGRAHRPIASRIAAWFATRSKRRERYPRKFMVVHVRSGEPRTDCGCRAICVAGQCRCGRPGR